MAVHVLVPVVDEHLLELDLGDHLRVAALDLHEEIDEAVVRRVHLVLGVEAVVHLDQRELDRLPLDVEARSLGLIREQLDQLRVALAVGAHEHRAEHVWDACLG